MNNRKGFAIAAIVLGIISMILIPTLVISIVVGVVAVIFGILSIHSSKKSLAITGICTGAIAVIVSVFIIIVARTGLESVAPVGNITENDANHQQISIPQQIENVSKDEAVAAVVLGEDYDALGHRNSAKAKFYDERWADLTEEQMENLFDSLAQAGTDYTLQAVKVNEVTDDEINGVGVYAFEGTKKNAQLGKSISVVAFDFNIMKKGDFYTVAYTGKHTESEDSSRQLAYSFALVEESKKKFGTDNLNEWAANQSWRPVIE